MKKRSIILFVTAGILFVLCIFIFHSKSEITDCYSRVGNDGKTETFQFMADTLGHTVTINGDVYKYEKKGNALTVTWPDGIRYTENTGAGVTAGGGSGAIDSEKYQPQEVVFGILDEVFRHDPVWNAVIGWQILMILLGAAMVIIPEFFWFLCYGWRYQNAEPGVLALPAVRCFGVFAIAFAVIKFF